MGCTASGQVRGSQGDKDSRPPGEWRPQCHGEKENSYCAHECVHTHTHTCAWAQDLEEGTKYTCGQGAGEREQSDPGVCTGDRKTQAAPWPSPRSALSSCTARRVSGTPFREKQTVRGDQASPLIPGLPGATQVGQQGGEELGQAYRGAPAGTPASQASPSPVPGSTCDILCTLIPGQLPPLQGPEPRQPPASPGTAQTGQTHLPCTLSPGVLTVRKIAQSLSPPP